MSREILAFSAFAAVVGGFTGAAVWPWLTSALPTLNSLPVQLHPAGLVVPLSIITATLAVLSVYCSAMIYIDTRREFWCGPLVFTKFFGTTFALGCAGCAAVLAWEAVNAGALLVGAAARSFIALALIGRLALFGRESLNLHHGLNDLEAPAHRSMLTIWTLGRPLAFAHVVLFVGAMWCGVLALTSPNRSAAISATISFAFTLAAQAIERYLFFTAVVAPRMPGGAVT